MIKKDLGRLRLGEIIAGWIWWLMFLIGTEFVVVLVITLLGHDLREISESPKMFSYVNLSVGLVNLTALLIIFHRFLWEQFSRLRRRGWRILTDLLLGIAVYFGASYAASYVSEFLIAVFRVDYYNANQEAVEQLVSVTPAIGVFLASFEAPITEELLNRGLIFNPLRRRCRVPAYILSMLIFSSIHVVGSVFYQPVMVSVVSLVAYCGPGFALAWIYDRSETIWAPIFLHAIINTLATLLS